MEAAAKPDWPDRSVGKPFETLSVAASAPNGSLPIMPRPRGCFRGIACTSAGMSIGSSTRTVSTSFWPIEEAKRGEQFEVADDETVAAGLPLVQPERSFRPS